MIRHLNVHLHAGLSLDAANGLHHELVPVLKDERAALACGPLAFGEGGEERSVVRYGKITEQEKPVGSRNGKTVVFSTPNRANFYPNVKHVFYLPAWGGFLPGDATGDFLYIPRNAHAIIGSPISVLASFVAGLNVGRKAHGSRDKCDIVCDLAAD
jgi:hypothetical protein